MDALIPDDPSTLFLLGVVVTAVGFWIKEKLDIFASQAKRGEAKADRVNANQSDIRIDLSAIETKIASFEKRLETHDQVRDLVTRLDERMAAMTDELKRQPHVIAVCVGEAIKAAFRYAPPAAQR